jgi:spermidine synthase
MKNLILIISFIWLGIIAIIAQTLCIRELLVMFFGNELCLGIIFTAWLVGITVGAFIGSFITDKFQFPIPFFSVLLLLITIILPLEAYLIRLFRLILNIPLGQHIPFFETIYMSFILVMPFSIIVGIAFPVSCKVYTLLKQKTTETTGAIQIGWVYIWEAIGSLIGGIVFTFYLVERFTIFEIIFVSNFISSTLGFLVFLITPIKPLRLILLTGKKTFLITPIHSFIIYLLIILANLVVATELTTKLQTQSIQKRWNSLTGGDIKLVKSTDSRYGNIAIGKLQDQYSLVENGKFISSFPDEYTHSPLAHLFLTQHPLPQNVLLIGGGIEGIIKEMLKYPLKNLHYVQLDPKIIEVLTPYLPVQDLQIIHSDQRLHIHYVDGRRFIKQTRERFDLIIINLPDPSTAMINRFYTKEFFLDAKNVLNKGGVLITRVSSAVNYFSETIGNYVGSVYDTLSSVFEYVLCFPGTDAYFFVSDTENTVTFDISILDRRYRDSKVDSKYLISPAYFEMVFPEWHIKLTNKALQNKKNKYLNTDLQPITYFFNLILWDTITKERVSEKTFFKTIANINFRWFIIFLLTVLVIRLIYIRLTQNYQPEHQRFNSLLSIFVIGLSGLSLELIIIFGFQNIHGYIYQVIGFMVSLFMAGLAIGGFFSNKILIAPRSTNVKNLLNAIVLIHILMLLVSFSLPYILSILSGITSEKVSLSIIFSVMVFIGMLTGMVYPLLSQVYLLSGAEVGKTAGLIDTLDHLGACLGALLTGVFVIPIFGIIKTCILISLLNLLVIIFISTHPVRTGAKSVPAGSVPTFRPGRSASGG